MDRTSFPAIWMEMAALMAKRATCPRLSVGAVLVNPEQQIISTGYNGAPPGHNHCSAIGCLMDSAGRCKRTVHAEANALLQCAMNGRSPKGCSMYVTHRPCVDCTKLIVSCGLRSIHFLNDYDGDGLHQEIMEMFQIARMTVSSGDPDQPEWLVRR